jgi:formate/nitrite transporter FocA (FNT family)
MYFLPLAWLMTRTGNVPPGFDASAITMAGIIHNLVPVTLGNIVGGAGLVGAMYWMIYRAAFGQSRPGQGRIKPGS